MDTLGRVARILAVAVVVGYSVLVMVDVVGSMPPDAVTYLAAGERLNAGHPLYSLSPGDRPITTDVPGISVPLLSPPGIAIVWRPLAALGEWTVIPWWILGSALFVIALSVVVWRAWPTIAIVVLVLEPIAWLVAFGNVHAYIAAGMVLLWFVRDRPWAAAALAVSMAALKLTPAPLVLWIARDRRTWVPILAISAVWLAAILVFAPGALAEYVDVMRTRERRDRVARPCRRARCDAGPASARGLCGRGRDDDARHDVRGHPLVGGAADRADPVGLPGGRRVVHPNEAHRPDRCVGSPESVSRVGRRHCLTWRSPPRGTTRRSGRARAPSGSGAPSGASGGPSRCSRRGAGCCRCRAGRCDWTLDRLADAPGRPIRARPLTDVSMPGADVEDLALGPRVDRRQERRLDRVVDVGVVAGLLAVAVDRQRLDRRCALARNFETTPQYGLSGRWPGP